MSVALQSLIVNAAGKEIIRRTAICERHQEQTSNFLGPTHNGWEFRCRKGHLFYADPDPHAPKTKEGIEAWTLKQRSQRLKTLG